MEGKKTRGRQKIDTTKRREGERERLITFSKRRVGLYKKASELCTLCDPQLAILISAPSGNQFCFGNPNFETVMNHFRNRGNPFFGIINEFADSGAKARIKDLNSTLTQVKTEFAKEKERQKELEKMAKMRKTKKACEKDVDELSDEEVTELKAWLLDLMVKISYRAEELKSHDYNATGWLVDPNVASSSNANGGV